MPLSGCTPFRTNEVWGQFAFASVLIVTFGQLALSSQLRGEPWQVLLVFGLGMVYGTVAVVSGRWIRPETPRRRAAYFAFQFALCAVLIAFSPNRNFFWIIVLPLAAQAIFDLRWPAALLITLGLFALSVAGIWIPYGPSAGWQVLLGFSPAFIFTAVFSFLSARALAARQEAERLTEQLTAANEQLRARSAQAEELATSRERNRLAREIHDGLGHYLTVINVQIEAARALLARAPASAADPLGKAARLSREALEEVRASVANLHRDVSPEPLPARLHRLAHQAGPEVRCQVLGATRALSTAAEHALFRAAQEGLTNVRKHAGRTAADLLLDYRGRERVALRVLDRGAGTPAASGLGTSGFGLRGMRERVHLLGGTVVAGAREGGGFELTVELPG